jgi:hypothetical protein
MLLGESERSEDLAGLAVLTELDRVTLRPGRAASGGSGAVPLRESRLRKALTANTIARVDSAYWTASKGSISVGWKAILRGESRRNDRHDTGPHSQGDRYHESPRD